MYEQASERWSPVQSVEKVILSVISMLAGERAPTFTLIPLNYEPPVIPPTACVSVLMHTPAIITDFTAVRLGRQRLMSRQVSEFCQAIFLTPDYSSLISRSWNITSAGAH